jgi:hypothetical protein
MGVPAKLRIADTISMGEGTASVEEGNGAKKMDAEPMEVGTAAIGLPDASVTVGTGAARMAVASTEVANGSISDESTAVGVGMRGSGIGLITSFSGPPMKVGSDKGKGLACAANAGEMRTPPVRSLTSESPEALETAAGPPLASTSPVGAAAADPDDAELLNNWKTGTASWAKGEAKPFGNESRSSAEAAWMRDIIACSR